MMMSSLLDAIMIDLHKFMVAISRIEVNHDGYGGTAQDAMVWDRGGIVKPRASSFRLIVDHATLPGSPGFLSGTWCTLHPLPITQEDVAVRPSSFNILLVFSFFWPLYIGLGVMVISANLVFLILNCF